MDRKEHYIIESTYFDKGADPSALEDWLLENGNNPDADKLLRELQAKTSTVDDTLSETAFKRFAEATGISSKRPWKRFQDIAIKTAAALCIPAIAAAIVAVTIVGKNKTQWHQISTSCSESRNLALSDGTAIRLGACTKVIYPDRFTGSTRKIFVTGDVYMDVAKDASKPFVVSAGAFDVSVHGTRFHLKSTAESEEDELALIEGSVSLNFTESNQSVDVIPGELIRYNKITDELSRRTFSTNYYEEAIKQDGLIFTDAKLCDIISSLSGKFGTEIIIEDTSVKSERYYASFINNETLDEILNTLNTRNHLKIEHDNGVIRIWKNSK